MFGVHFMRRQFDTATDMFALETEQPRRFRFECISSDKHAAQMSLGVELVHRIAAEVEARSAVSVEAYDHRRIVAGAQLDTLDECRGFGQQIFSIAALTRHAQLSGRGHAALLAEL
jgi:hypothetical protein